ncbi:aspartic peptidase domain-containing protein [Hyaloscypha finlandica]|nr:aspartic peptidase domain-containing protein [Hyaloscypha finlandica]
MMRYLSLALFTLGSLALEHLPPIHYTISRRGGSFPAPDIANLTYLLEQLRVVEQRYNSTTRDFIGNKVVRKPKRPHGTQALSTLLGDVGRDGNWLASLHIGDPIQEVDMDLDMLTADWWIFSTSSGKGSFYLDFNSKTYGKTSLSFRCPELTEPAKQWVRTLLPSGAYLGLAASTALSQTKTVSLMMQMIEKNVINTPVWSLVLINGKDGIFSIGGTSAPSVRRAKMETDDELARAGNYEVKRDEVVASRSAADIEMEADLSANEWKWSKVQGAEGWWQILMRGIWVDGNKVLENQPIVLDINTPFILAPPVAARAFYSSVSWSRQLPPPYDQFHAYPCFNPPKIHFEFAGWNVEVLKGKRDKGAFSAGGRFSLGRMASGSGYCLGIVVESRMGKGMSLGTEAGNMGFETSMEGGNGLEDVWIVGEPFFRDVQVAFDWKEKKVGIQRV